MKTITVIYRNDDIFKDNQRYPIDAPFREFYKELTEKYVPAHKLDNIFYDPNGEAKIGEYFFEYEYDYNKKKFSIYTYPEELGKENSANYVPMLHSMVTGETINWEVAREEVTFSKKAKVEPTKILLVFGKDTLKTLDFSWLASFETSSTSEMKLSEIINEIKQQKDEIINATQGVLFSELDYVILGFLQSQKQYEHTKNLIKDHKHTLKNFGLKGALNLLYHQIKDDPDKLKVYNYVENLDLLHDYMTDILYNFGNKPQQLLLYKRFEEDKKEPTYTEILKLIHNATREHDTDKIKYESNLSYHPLNKVDVEDLSNVFTVLLNLYSNSNNWGKGDFEISVTAFDDKIEILFRNKTEMPNSFIDYFLNKSTSVDKGEGIGFIRDALNKMKHIDRKCEVSTGYTNITLMINGKR